MRPVFRVLISVLVLIFVGALALPTFFKFDDLRSKINTSAEKIISEGVTGSETAKKSYIKINGKIKLKVIPFPRISVQNVEIKNIRLNNAIVNGRFPQMEIYVSPIKLLFGKLFAKKVKLMDSEFFMDNIELLQTNEIALNEDAPMSRSYLDADSKQFSKIQKAILEEISNSKFKHSGMFVELKNVDFYFNNLVYSTKFLKTNMSMDFHDGFEIKGSSELNGRLMEIEARLKNNRKKQRYHGDVKILSSILKLTSDVQGTYSEPFRKEDFEISGDSKLEIKNIQLFTKWLFNKNSWQYKKVISDEDLVFDFNVSSEGGIIKVSDMSVKSVNIKGAGNVQYDLREGKSSLLDLSFDGINLDKLVTKGLAGTARSLPPEMDIFSEAEADEEVPAKTSESTLGSFVFDNSDFKIRTEIKTILYNNQTIQDFSLDMETYKDGSLRINDLSVNVPDNGKLVVKGEKSLSFESGGFFGKFAAKGDKLKTLLTILNTNTESVSEKYLSGYDFAGDLKILNNELYLNDFNLEFDDVKTEGSAKIVLDRGISYVFVDANLDRFNASRYLDDQIKTWLKGDSLKEKLLWLNSFNLNTIFNLKIGELKYKNYTGNNDSVKLSYGQGFLKIRDIDLSDDSFGVRGSVEFDIRAKNPLINADLNFDKLSFDFDDLESNDIVDLLFKIPAMQEFIGSVNFNIFEGSVNDVNLKNFTLTSEIINGRASFDNFVLEAFDGKSRFKGHVDIKNTRELNLVFDGCSFRSGDFFNLFTKNKNIDGLFITSGILNSSGFDRETFLNNMTGKFKFKGANVKVKKFGLKDLMLSMFKIHKNRELLNNFNTTKTLYNQDTETVFKDVDGQFQVNKNRKILFKSDLKNVGISGLFNGDIEDGKIDGVSTFTILAGTKKKQVPLNLIVKLDGDVENVQKATNISQVEEYVKSVRKILLEGEEGAGGQ